MKLSFEPIIEPFLNFLYPPDCAGCSTAGDLLCADCLAQLAYIEAPVCPTCGCPGITDRNSCKHCHAYKLSYINSVNSVVFYQEPVTSIIHNFKYNNQHAFAYRLAQLLATCYLNNNLQTTVIIPAPLHSTRQKVRGYNQSALLATQLAKIINQPVKNKIMVRKRETKQQISLNPSQRKENVADAFTVRTEQLAGQSVLLIDDVFTTGATLNACAKALKQGKASAVHGLTLARVREP